MHFDRLRLSGFKSFVEHTDLDILPGLTGIVGPNGCGKSNLVEALRWVMGETSYKSMRASGMEDVIFAGTNLRPARNHAEVSLFLNNQAHDAPAEYNQDDELQISRRIERESGSAYRINGTDVRARDVQLFFADSSTGARSTALVQQGQIGALITAKPVDRRKILEEAAGITGLHSRRHDAELRLRAAETNLMRVDDNLGQLETHLRGLKRQERQAKRYKNIAEQMRQAEALLLYLRWHIAQTQCAEAEKTLAAAQASLQEATTNAARTSTAQVAAQEHMQTVREAEAEAAAALRRVQHEKDTLSEKEQHARTMLEGLKEQIDRLEHDHMVEVKRLEDALAQLQALALEDEKISAESEADEGEDEARAEEKFAALQQQLSEAEHVLDEINQKSADHKAKMRALEEAVSSSKTRAERLLSEKQNREENKQLLLSEIVPEDFVVQLRNEIKTLEAQIEKQTTQYDMSRRSADELAAKCEELREARQKAELESEKYIAEQATLMAVFAQADDVHYTPLMEHVTVATGYETALGAALGDDLQASENIEAPTHWRLIVYPLGHPSAQNLPAGVRPLSDFVKTDPLLSRRLSQIGVVEPEQGADLQAQLLPGQRLVSRQGDLWRWDGYCATVAATEMVANALQQRNRLQELALHVPAARKKLAQAVAQETAASQKHQAAAQSCAQLQADIRDTEKQLADKKQDLAEAEKTDADYQARITMLDEALSRLQDDLEDVQQAQTKSKQDLHVLSQDTDFESEGQNRQHMVEELRAQLATARVEAQAIRTRRELREQNKIRVAQEINSWAARKDTSAARVAEIDTRLQDMRTTYKNQQVQPELFAEQQRQLLDLLSETEEKHKKASDIVVQAEAALRASDQAVQKGQSVLSDARADHARCEERNVTENERLAQAVETLSERLQVSPKEALNLSGYAEEEGLPAASEVEAKLEKYRRERENLGGVNLRAEEEAKEMQSQIDAITAEREELGKAIHKLRYGIGQLNREGRQRLLDAFEKVNAHFQKLFVQLFGGGKAELQLVDSDDPLEAGLEILAHPPGKKPQIMSLLSGGEQALTATALTFAVFLTNPSPICVLDEVDAPLDDANVERYCNLVREIQEETGTRFLIITHHALTMARMDRLFGVTMQEHGVSQLLSVDLQTAEGYAHNEQASRVERIAQQQ